jgi:hypothetical protein
MKIAVKSPEPAVYRRGLGIFLTETPLPSPFSPASGPALVFIHKSGPMFRGIEGGVKISENNSVHVRSGRLNWVCVTERTHA